MGAYTEVRVMRHWDGDEEGERGKPLYRLYAETPAEWTALLIRLAKYAYAEENMVEHPEMELEHLREEKAALEWRMNMLNMQLAAQQGGDHVP